MGKLAVVGRRVREDEEYTVDTSLARLQTPQTAGDVVLWSVTATDYETPSDNYETPTDIGKLNEGNSRLLWKLLYNSPCNICFSFLFGG